MALSQQKVGYTQAGVYDLPTAIRLQQILLDRALRSALAGAAGEVRRGRAVGLRAGVQAAPIISEAALMSQAPMAVPVFLTRTLPRSHC